MANWDSCKIFNLAKLVLTVNNCSCIFLCFFAVSVKATIHKKLVDQSDIAECSHSCTFSVYQFNLNVYKINSMT